MLLCAGCSLVELVVCRTADSRAEDTEFLLQRLKSQKSEGG